MKILVLEDDKPTSEFLRKGLTEAGFNVDMTDDGQEAEALASSVNYDLLILDIMVPGKDGLALVQALRRNKISAPVLFLSAKRSLEERIEGLQKGGDDYLTKPYSFSELLARVQAVLRRTAKGAEAYKLTYQDLEMDLLGRSVRSGSHTIELQQKEYALLEYLMRNQGRVLTKTQILETVWQYNFDPQTNVVDVLVCRLRNKLERETSKKFIKTIRGVGYVLRED